MCACPPVFGYCSGQEVDEVPVDTKSVFRRQKTGKTRSTGTTLDVGADLQHALAQLRCKHLFKNRSSIAGSRRSFASLVSFSNPFSRSVSVCHVARKPNLVSTTTFGFVQRATSEAFTSIAVRYKDLPLCCETTARESLLSESAAHFLVCTSSPVPFPHCARCAILARG